MPMSPDYKRGECEIDLVATHQRVLVGSVMRTQGPILELGVGWYSTPILHELAEGLKRHLFTVDNIDYWLAQFRPLRSEYHTLYLLDWWGNLRDYVMSNVPHFGLCFVDQGQPAEREYTIRAMLDKVDVFVMHDTEEPHAYGYSRTLGMFRYSWTDKCQKAWTTVASNKIDVSKWFTELPPVESSKEVT